MKKLLVLFECSRIVASEFEKIGWEAWSCDLKPSEKPSKFHLQMDFKDALETQKWDMIIMHPPCTYLSISGIHWNNRGRGWEKTENAVSTVEWLIDYCESRQIPYCLENPVGILSSRIRKPDQIIQPYQFGEDASKRTCLWLFNLPKLQIPPKTEWFPPRIVNGKRRYGNQLDNGQNKLGQTKTRAANRSRTYQKIAEAMVKNWG